MCVSPTVHKRARSLVLALALAPGHVRRDRGREDAPRAGGALRRGRPEGDSEDHVVVN